MAGPSWIKNNQAAPSGTPAPGAPSFLGGMKAGEQSVAPEKLEKNNGIIDGYKAAVQALERGLTGGLSDRFHHWLNEKVPALAPSPEETESRRNNFPLLSMGAESIGHTIAAPVTTLKEGAKKLTGFQMGDNIPILPENQYFNPTVGGVASGIGDIAVYSPELIVNGIAKAYPLLQKMSGLSEKSAQVFAENPKSVEALANTLKTGEGAGQLKDKLQTLLFGSAKNIGNVGKEGADLQRVLVDGHLVDIPVSQLRAVSASSPVAAKAVQKAVDKAKYFGIEEAKHASIPAGDALDILSELGTEFSRVNPLTGQKMIPEQGMSAGWSAIRSLMSEHPGQISDAAKAALQKAGFSAEGSLGTVLDKIRANTAQGIDLQKSLVQGAKRAPISALNTASLDKIGTVQNAAGKYKLAPLENELARVQAARELNMGAEAGSDLLGPLSHVLPLPAKVAAKSAWSLMPGAKAFGQSHLPSAWEAMQAGPQTFKPNPWQLIPVGRNLIEEQTNE